MEMTLSQLVAQCSVTSISGDTDMAICGLSYDSRQVKPGHAFFALRGVAGDGHDFIAQALASGAKAVFVEQPVDVPADVATVVAPDCRKALALAARSFFADPTDGMIVVGVTGTNGKTTVTYLLESILTAAGLAPAVMGTVNYRFGSEAHQASHTTPESVDLMARLRAFRDAGANALVMEVSSHALEQHRADGVRFQVGVFTNLTPEHLDYHGDMEAYFASKCHLFTELLPQNGKSVANLDDPYGRKLADMVDNALTCSQTPQADIASAGLTASLAGIHGKIATPLGEVEVASPLLGDFNIENILCAVGAAVALKITPQQIADGLKQAGEVPGRLERIENELGAVILVDYAHTGDALKRVVETMQQLGPQRILTIFGCGGDRDRDKRPVMAEVAARGSDIAIATSDNPRNEDPQQIFADMQVGLNRVHEQAWSVEQAETAEGRGYLVIPDRREAIQLAVSLLRQDDLLLVAGKGHEDYQILGSETIHFDDREELRAALAARTQR